jgi:NAD+ kinase
MKHKLHNILILGNNPNKELLQSRIVKLISALSKLGITIWTIDSISSKVDLDIKIASLEDLDNMDLAVVIGGDGNFLSAAKIVMQHNILMVGLNYGTIGFLSDINPTNNHEELVDIINGDYKYLDRVLIEIKDCLALNEIYITNQAFKLIQFQIIINNEKLPLIKADGLIVSTPTGSTAHSLSAGGPIVTPNVKALIITPVNASTLGYTPIVVPDNAKIEIKALNVPTVGIIDGVMKLNFVQNENINIRESFKRLRVAHPLSFNYFHTLSTKLGKY